MSPEVKRIGTGWRLEVTDLRNSGYNQSYKLLFVISKQPQTSMEITEGQGPFFQSSDHQAFPLSALQMPETYMHYMLTGAANKSC